MAGRAVGEGAMSPFRITLIWPDFFDDDDELESDHLTVNDLLKMTKEDRNATVARAFELAADMEFEIFEANEVYDYFDDSDEAINDETF